MKLIKTKCHHNKLAKYSKKLKTPPLTAASKAYNEGYLDALVYTGLIGTEELDWLNKIYVKTGNVKSPYIINSAGHIEDHS